MARVTAILRVYDPTKATLLGTLPDWSDLAVQREFLAEGSLTFGYNKAGLGAGVLDNDDALVALVVNGVERPDLYVLEDDGDDDADEAQTARTVQVGCRGALALLERARVYPSNHTPGASVNGLEPTFKFTAATAGAIAKTLIDRAQARGAIPQVTYAFTATNDSNGVPWASAYDVSFDMGVDLMKVLQAMADNDWCDFRMAGLALVLVNPDTMGTDRPAVILHVGQQVTSGPRKRSRRGIASVMLGLGDEQVAAEVTNTAALARYGRREAYEAQGGIGSVDTLTAVTTARLFLASAAAEGFTVGLVGDADGPQPDVDYFIGDKVRYGPRRLDTTNLEPMRVRSIADAWDDNGVRGVSVEFNDVFMETSLRLARRLDGVLNGSTASGTIPTPGGGPDGTIPGTPTILSITSLGEVDALGGSTAFVAVAWSTVTTNTDGSAITDLAGYQMEWKRASEGTWTDGGTTTATSGSIHGVPITTQIHVRVAAVDTSGNVGAFSAVVAHSTVSDVAPPPQPAQPTVTVRLGVATVYWNGLGSANETMPGDFWRVEVHMSITNNFTATTATIQGYISAAGNFVIADLPYNQVRYVKFVGVDRSGNKSAASVQRSFTVTPLVNTDLIGQILSSANFQGGAVDTAALATGAVDASKILAGAVTFGKVAANAIGVNELAANSVVAGKIAANAVTAGTVAALAISAGNIQANAITADKIAAGQITAEKIAVGAIDANSISVGMFGVNRVPNPGLEDLRPGTNLPARWAIRDAGNGTFSTDTYPINSGTRAGVLFASASNGFLSASCDSFPVSPGEELVVSAWMRAGSPSSAGAYLRIVWNTTAAPGFTGSYADLATNGGLGGGYGKVAGRAIVPQGIRWASVWIYWWDQPGGTALYFDDVVCQAAVTGVEIVNGAVTAAKISADAIDGKTITGNTINGGTINGGTINSVTLNSTNVYGTNIYGGGIYGALVQGGTVRTSNNSQRVEINENQYTQILMWYSGDNNPADIRYGQSDYNRYMQVYSADRGGGRSHLSLGAGIPNALWPAGDIVCDGAESGSAASTLYLQAGKVRIHSGAGDNAQLVVDGGIRIADVGGGTWYGMLASIYYGNYPGFLLQHTLGNPGSSLRLDGDGWARIVYGNNISAYSPIAASSFSAQSSRTTKALIGDGSLGRPAVDVLRGAAPAKWRRKGASTGHPGFQPAYGVMAEDLPSDLVNWGEVDDPSINGQSGLVDLTTLIGLVWQATRELDDRITTLEGPR